MATCNDKSQFYGSIKSDYLKFKLILSVSLNFHIVYKKCKSVTLVSRVLTRVSTLSHDHFKIFTAESSKLYSNATVYYNNKYTYVKYEIWIKDQDGPLTNEMIVA